MGLVVMDKMKTGEIFFDFQYYMSLKPLKEFYRKKISENFFLPIIQPPPTRHTYQFVEAENKYQTYTY